MVVAVEVGDAVLLAPVAVDLAVRAGRPVAPEDRRLERAARREAVGAVDRHLRLAVAVEVREAQLGEARTGRVVRFAAEAARAQPAGEGDPAAAATVIRIPVAPVMIVSLAAPTAVMVAVTGPADALTTRARGRRRRSRTRLRERSREYS